MDHLVGRLNINDTVVATREDEYHAVVFSGERHHVDYYSKMFKADVDKCETSHNTDIAKCVVATISDLDLVMNRFKCKGPANVERMGNTVIITVCSFVDYLETWTSTRKGF